MEAELKDPQGSLSQYIDSPQSWFIPPLKRALKDWLRNTTPDRGHDPHGQWVNDFIAAQRLPNPFLWSFQDKQHRLHLLQLRLCQYFMDFEDHGLSEMYERAHQEILARADDPSLVEVKQDRFNPHFYGPYLSAVNTWMATLTVTQHTTAEDASIMAFLLFLYEYVRVTRVRASQLQWSATGTPTPMAWYVQLFTLLCQHQPVRFAQALRRVLPPPGMSSSLNFLVQVPVITSETIFATLESRILFVPRLRMSLTKSALPDRVAFFLQDKEETFGLFLLDRWIRARWASLADLDLDVMRKLLQQPSANESDFPVTAPHLWWMDVNRHIGPQALYLQARLNAMVAAWTTIEAQFAQRFEVWMPPTPQLERRLHSTDIDHWPEWTKMALRVWWFCPLHRDLYLAAVHRHEKTLQRLDMAPVMWLPSDKPVRHLHLQLYLHPDLSTWAWTDRIAQEDERVMQEILPLYVWLDWALYLHHWAQRYSERVLFYWTRRLVYKRDLFRKRMAMWTELVHILMPSTNAISAISVAHGLWKGGSTSSIHKWFMSHSQGIREDHDEVVEEDEEKYPSQSQATATASWPEQTASWILRQSERSIVDALWVSDEDPRLPAAPLYQWLTKGGIFYRRMRQFRDDVVIWELQLIKWMHTLVDLTPAFLQEKDLTQGLADAHSTWTVDRTRDIWKYVLRWKETAEQAWITQEVEMDGEGTLQRPLPWSLDERNPALSTVAKENIPWVPTNEEAFGLQHLTYQDWTEWAQTLGGEDEDSRPRLSTPWANIGGHEYVVHPVLEGGPNKAEQKEIVTTFVQSHVLVLLRDGVTWTEAPLLRMWEGQVLQVLILQEKMETISGIPVAIWDLVRTDYPKWAELLEALNVWPLEFQMAWNSDTVGARDSTQYPWDGGDGVPPGDPVPTPTLSPLERDVFIPSVYSEHAYRVWKDQLPPRLVNHHKGLSWSLYWLVSVIQTRWQWRIGNGWNKGEWTEPSMWSDAVLYTHVWQTFSTYLLCQVLYELVTDRTTQPYESPAETTTEAAATWLLLQWSRWHSWMLVREVLRRVGVKVIPPSINDVEPQLQPLSRPLEELEAQLSRLTLTPIPLSPHLLEALQWVRVVHWATLESFPLSTLDKVWAPQTGINPSRLPLSSSLKAAMLWMQAMTTMIPIMKLFRTLWIHRIPAAHADLERRQEKWTRLWEYLQSRRR